MYCLLWLHKWNRKLLSTNWSFCNGYSILLYDTQLATYNCLFCFGSHFVQCVYLYADSYFVLNVITSDSSETLLLMLSPYIQSPHLSSMLYQLALCIFKPISMQINYKMNFQWIIFVILQFYSKGSYSKNLIWILSQNWWIFIFQQKKMPVEVCIEISGNLPDIYWRMNDAKAFDI